MPYSRIVIGTDLSDDAAAAAQVAPLFGHPRTQYRVTFIRPDPWPPLRDAPRVQDTRQAIEMVGAWATNVGLRDAQASVSSGSVGRALVRDAESVGADLVVLGHRGRTRVPRRLLGSTARAVLRAATLDTLIVRRGEGAPRDPQLRRIVVATDFHAPSEVAAQRAYALAKAHECDLHLVHVVDPSLWYDPDVGESTRPLDRSLADELQERLGSFDRESLHGAATKALLRGRPASEVASYATRESADLVVIGNHGAGALERAMIGSSAEGIAELAPCSVLVVRSGGA